MKKEGASLWWLAAFAVAMAYLEAAVVVYLRRIYYTEDILSLFPLKVWAPTEILLEMGREVSTVVMILALAALAERGFARRFAAFAFLFGVWDVFYYVWLKVLIGWPLTWTEWDILFLIPWAWLGPWISPVFIAVILAGWGAAVLTSDREPPCRFRRTAVLTLGAGIAVVLYTFLEPGFPLVAQYPKGVETFEPGGFLWGLFVPGAGAMAVGFSITLQSKE